MEGEVDHFALRPAPEGASEAEKKLFYIKERRRIGQCMARQKKNQDKKAKETCSSPAQQPKKTSAAPTPASTQEPAVMGCLATQRLAPKGDYAQVDAAQYDRLKKWHDAYRHAISEWVASFHGADVEQISAAMKKALDAGHQLQREMNAFAYHATLETDKRVQVQKLGRALLENDVALLEQELCRRRLPVADEEPLPAQLRGCPPSRRQEQPSPPSPAQWRYAHYQTEADGPGFPFSPSWSTPPPTAPERSATKRTSAYSRIHPPIDRSSHSRNPGQSRQEQRSPSAKRRTESPGLLAPPAAASNPSGPDPTQRQRTRPARPAAMKEKPKSLPPLPPAAHLFSPTVEDASKLPPLKEVPEQPEVGDARLASPIRVAGPTKEVEEMLLCSPVVAEMEEVANGSRPPTPDVADKEPANMEVDNPTETSGPAQAIQEQEARFRATWLS